ncbi:MAG: DNA methyltransferase, partial [Limisphaerales bacterium]
MNQLYYGDNINVLRDSIANESVDLIYLDPPFNSKRDYNLLFKSPKGQESDAQITAFEDSWHWATEKGSQAEREFDEILHGPNTVLAEMMKALRSFLGQNDMMAYLTMMANRLVELHHVLKPTGSLYLHCDPTASHYLKIVLDGVMGKENFRNEISWQRALVKGDARQKFGTLHDVIFFYTKTDDYVICIPRRDADEAYLGRFDLDDNDGKGAYHSAPLDSPNVRPNLTYDYKG